VFSPEQLDSAITAGEAFWAALADDDDERLAALFSSTYLAHLHGSGRLPPPPAIIRAALECSPEACGSMGRMSKADVLGHDTLRIFWLVTGPRPAWLVDEPMLLYPLELVLEDGAWRVEIWVRLGAHRPAVATIDLPGPPRPPADA
jgi:hypothetical protein